MTPSEPRDYNGVLLQLGDPVISTTLLHGPEEAEIHGVVVAFVRGSVIEVRYNGTVWRSSARLWKKGES